MKFFITCIIAAGLVACGQPDAERQKVLDDLKKFQEKCLKNPQEKECKDAEGRKGG